MVIQKENGIRHMAKSRNLAIVSHHILRKGSGQGRINYELIKHLEGKYDIDVYAEHIDNDLLRNVNFHSIKVPQNPGIVKSPIFVTIASSKLLFKKYDIVQIDSGCAFTPYNISICHFCHTSCLKYEKGFYHRFYTRLNSWIEKIIYRRKSGLIIAVSRKIKTELEEFIGIDPNRIRVIYNGVNTEEFNSCGRSLSRKRLIEKYALDKNSFLLLFVGDLIERKGIDYLLEAVKKLDENTKLLIAGMARKKYIKKVEKDGLKQRVIFMGFQTNMPEIYKGVDAFIFPTLYDSFGNVVLEAMASGLPVIVSKFSGASEIITDGVDGIILKKPQNVEKLIEKIQVLKKNRALCEQIGFSARKTAEIYSWTKMAEEIERLLQRLATPPDAEQPDR